jgi:hypothetical protein
MRFARVALTAIDHANPIASLRNCLALEAPELRNGAIAIVDSPRTPLDLDCSSLPFIPITANNRGRAIDATLHDIVRRLNANPARQTRLRLSLFPSRAAKYFTDCAFHPDCKPHLAALGLAMFTSPA